MQNHTSSPQPPLDTVAGHGLLLADRAGRCIQVDRGWTELTGSAAESNLGEGWLECVHPDDRPRLRSQWEAGVRTTAANSAAVRLRNPDGRVRNVTLAIAPTPADGGPLGFVMTLSDAGAQAGEPELAQARKMEAVGRLASGLAHDFANLLTMISGYTEIVLGRLAADDPLRLEVDEIRSAANRGSALTRQLLECSRRHPLEPHPLDVNAVVADMQKMLRRMIGEHIELMTNLSADAGPVIADPGQIEQVIMNLVINARDAMPRGGRIGIRTVNLDLDERHERVGRGLAPGPYLMLQVDDTGHGMDEETRARVFDPFFTTKKNGVGTGLGLTTVYGIVKQGGGDVSVESKPGRGTTFTILLPRATGGAQPAAPVQAARASKYGTETILLVEDEEGVRRLLQHVLSQYGYKVLEAANGPEALAIFEHHKHAVDLLLTDVVMPRMSGRELADRVSRMAPGIKVIFISGYTDEAILAGSSQPGAVFLPKPLGPDVLAARVREVLDGVTCAPGVQHS